MSLLERVPREFPAPEWVELAYEVEAIDMGIREYRAAMQFLSREELRQLEQLEQFRAGKVQECYEAREWSLLNAPNNG